MAPARTASPTAAVLGLLASAFLAGCSAQVDPADGLPLTIRFWHGQGSEDRLSVSADGTVTARLGPLDGDREVRCVLAPEALRDLGGAAVVDLEPGATEPVPDGADLERLQVTGTGGTAWLGQGGKEVVRLAKRLVQDVHLETDARQLCRPRT